MRNLARGEQMTEWSKHAGLAYRERKASSELLEAKALREERILATESADLWLSLASLFEESCRDFNQEVGESDLLKYRSTRRYTFAVNRKDTARLFEAEFVENRNLVRIKGHEGFGYHAQYRMCVKPGSTEVYFCSGDDVVSKEMIVRSALNGLLNIP
jgi:hypothetical protein